MVSLQDNQVRGQNFINFVDLVHLILYALQHFDFNKHKMVNFIISYQNSDKTGKCTGKEMEHNGTYQSSANNACFQKLQGILIGYVLS